MVGKYFSSCYSLAISGSQFLLIHIHLFRCSFLCVRFGKLCFARSFFFIQVVKFIFVSYFLASCYYLLNVALASTPFSFRIFVICTFSYSLISSRVRVLLALALVIWAFIVIFSVSEIHVLWLNPALRGFPHSSAGKESPAMQETPVLFLVMKIRWRGDRLPTPVFLGFPAGSAGKESACNAGDLGLFPGLGRSPGGGHGNPL